MNRPVPHAPEPAPGERPDQALSEAVAAIRPHLRGWLHAGMAPLALAAGIVLVALAPTTSTRIAAAIFAASTVVLFSVSAFYHRWREGTRTKATLKRLDHANIYLVIAGTYTPLALLLPRGQMTTLLTIAWAGAILGIGFRVFWHSAPRWLYVPLYLALGWVSMFYMVPMYRTGGPAVVTLVLVGGLFYSVGAVVYGFKRPNPSPRWFGFHEIFHACTLLAFAAHYIAVSLAVYGATPRGII